MYTGINGETRIAGPNGEIVSVTNNSLDVMLSDPTTAPIDTYFTEEISTFTLNQPTVKSGIDTLVYTFVADTGHGIAVNDEIILKDTILDAYFCAEVKDVVGDTITLDRPIDNVFPITSYCSIVNSNMAVDGSVTPRIFSATSLINPIDFTRFIITMTSPSVMDDGRFGSLVALTKGIVFRVLNGFCKTIFNFKTNSDIATFCYDVSYSTKAPAGSYGLRARITFSGQEKHGVAIRVGGSSVLQWIVQDDLTDLTTLRIVGQGHKTTGEAF